MEEKKQIIGSKYEIQKCIGTGSFGAIYQGLNIRTREKVAIKVETVNKETSLLTNETRVYQYLKDCKGVPNLRWYGVDKVNHYMVIDLLGVSLHELLKNKTIFSLQDVLRIGRQIIEILQGIHEKGMIHRDIKPNNFLLNPTRGLNNIHIIDFGLCKSYWKNEKCEHMEIKKTHQMIGTPNFASINAHRFIELSRRDDLESVGYMLIYFSLGTLPWRENRILNAEEMIKMKQQIVENESVIPKVLIDYMKCVQNLSFEERPFYEDYKCMFFEVKPFKEI